MARGCNLAGHPKREAIEMALKQNRHVAVIARQFRLDRRELEAHDRQECLCFRQMSAMKPVEAASQLVLPRREMREHYELCACAWCTLSPYRRLTRAWDEVSESERQRFVFEVNTAGAEW